MGSATNSLIHKPRIPVRRHSFRFRVAFNFAWFGALVSLLLSGGVYLFAHDSSQRLMDETLRAEMQDYLTRLERNPGAPLPATLTLSGHVLDGNRIGAAVPLPLRHLAPGSHDIDIDGQPHRVLVAEREGKRYIFLYNEALQHQRERHFLYYLGAGAAAMTLLSALGGFWLARRVVAPVTELAAKVSAAEPGGAPPAPITNSNLDEVGELALTFERYLTRINNCMERERAFTANVSHELRTPLAIIRGAVEVLGDDAELNSKQRQRIARIEQASHDMTDLTSALLHLAREESAQRTENVDTDMAEIVRESIEKNRTMAHDRTLEISLEVAQEVRLPVARILAVVLVDNLVGNAFHHTGSGQVSVRLEPDRLVISDTGTGIAETDLGLIFQRHYRGAASTGAGIGLSLVKRICELHGWEIHIESTPGRGTTVSLVFQAVPPITIS